MLVWILKWAVSIAMIGLGLYLLEVDFSQIGYIKGGIGLLLLVGGTQFGPDRWYTVYLVSNRHQKKV